DVLFPLLTPMLAADEESRCQACEAILRIDAERGLELVLPLLRDPDLGVRWFACECLAGLGGCAGGSRPPHGSSVRRGCAGAGDSGARPRLAGRSRSHPDVT